MTHSSPNQRFNARAGLAWAGAWILVAGGSPPAALASGGANSSANAPTSASTRAAAERPALSVEQIVARNVAARGGLDAWRKVESMVWIGHLQSEHAPMPSMGFVLEQQRPNKTRFRLVALNTRTERVFDGAQGWKQGPARQGGQAVQPYSSEELRFARTAPGLDGPLIDYAAKGSTVSLEGMQQLQGRKAYRLSVQLVSGERDTVWIDARNFLDLRYDRPVDDRGGSRVVSVFYRGYRAANGLLIPAVIETGAMNGSAPDRMTIERTVVNAPLDARTFERPGSQPHVQAPNVTQTPGPASP